MSSSSGNLHIIMPCIWSWNVALTLPVTATSQDNAIAPEQKCMFISCSNLYVGQIWIQIWKVTLPVIIPAASHRSAVVPEQNGVPAPGSSLRVDETRRQSGQIALPLTVAASSNHRPAIAPDQNRVGTLTVLRVVVAASHPSLHVGETRAGI